MPYVTEEADAATFCPGQRVMPAMLQADARAFNRDFIGWMRASADLADAEQRLGAARREVAAMRARLGAAADQAAKLLQASMVFCVGVFWCPAWAFFVAQYGGLLVPSIGFFMGLFLYPAWAFLGAQAERRARRACELALARERQARADCQGALARACDAHLDTELALGREREALRDCAAGQQRSRADLADVRRALEACNAELALARGELAARDDALAAEKRRVAQLLEAASANNPARSNKRKRPHAGDSDDFLARIAELKSELACLMRAQVTHASKAADICLLCRHLNYS